MFGSARRFLRTNWYSFVLFSAAQLAVISLFVTWLARSEDRLKNFFNYIEGYGGLLYPDTVTEFSIRVIYVLSLATLLLLLGMTALGVAWSPFAALLTYLTVRSNPEHTQKGHGFGPMLASTSLLLPWVYFQLRLAGIRVPHRVVRLTYGAVFAVWFAGPVLFLLVASWIVALYLLALLPEIYLYDRWIKAIGLVPSGFAGIIQLVPVFLGTVLPLILVPMFVAWVCLMTWKNSIMALIRPAAHQAEPAGTNNLSDVSLTPWRYLAPFTLAALWSVIGPLLMVGWMLLYIVWYYRHWAS